jgi:leader peptidase (prepilin peptidase) / N-methyltransferase
MPSDAQAMVDVAGAVRSAPATEAADAAAADAAAWPSVPRHPLVPVLAVGLPLLAVAKFGIGPQALVAAIASVVLTVLAAIDIEHRLLPNRIVLPATALLLALQVAFFPENALEWLLAGLAAAAFLALPLIVRRDAMGMGDIKLALLLGTIVGWQVFGAIVVGCLAIVPVALWMQMREGSIRNATLPFGPFLAFGTLLILFTS